MIENKNLEDFLPNKKSSYIKSFDRKNISQEIINKNDVIQCIKKVEDPEIPVNLYDL